MDVLRTIVSGLGAFLAGQRARRAPLRRAHRDRTDRQDADDRRRVGSHPPRARSDRAALGSFASRQTSSTCARGKVPHAIEEDALDTYFVLLADHSYNASTFAARVAASTRADIYASVTAALATLQGDLHGGAATAAYPHARTRSKTPENAEPYVRDIARRADERIMGMGHREYKVRDPRARHLEAMAQEARRARRRRADGTRPRTRSKRQAARCCKRSKPGNTIYANVDFYTAPVLSDLGHSGRRVHLSLRVRAHRRLDRAHPRAARRQPPDPAAGDLRRPGRPDRTCRSNNAATNGARG